jgi:GNAT superfamily N-acetyltransferase
VNSETPHTAAAHEVVVRVPLTHPDALRLVAEVQAEYVVRYGGEDHTPIDAEMFEPPHGAFFVAYRDGDPVATGGWRLRDDVEAFGTTRTAEVKRMYVAPRARGLGVARRMLARLEESAVEVGARAMILETGTAQPEAMALYESAGYVRIESFGHYRWSPQNRCYGITLPRE